MSGFISTVRAGFISFMSVISLVKSSEFFGRLLPTGLSGPILITSPLPGPLNRLFGLKLFPDNKNKKRRSNKTHFFGRLSFNFTVSQNLTDTVSVNIQEFFKSQIKQIKLPLWK